MATVLGIWIALAGLPSALAGLTGMRRVRRLRRDGAQAWATVVLRHSADGERQVALQYTLPGGQVLEKPAAGKTAALLPGERVLIRYDPADPLDVLVHGRERQGANLAFVIAGVVLVAAGVVIGIAAP
jgi:hypothetical protein